jgi:ubiquinone/menaquinone biosynthesis C-methylase UbiE
MSYNHYARIYNQFVGSFSANHFGPIIERTILRSLPPPAVLLDLCCGTGQIAQVLTTRGYHVTGVDSSDEMLRFARTNAPKAEFICADVNQVTLTDRYHAAFSVFDSLNHVLDLEDLTIVFQKVYTSLLDNGIFLFDLNMETAYKSRWNDYYHAVTNDYVYLLSPHYDADSKMAYHPLVLFTAQPDGTWLRTDEIIKERCYDELEILSALQSTGFTQVQCLDAVNDLGLPGQMGLGRAVFICQKR